MQYPVAVSWVLNDASNCSKNPILTNSLTSDVPAQVGDSPLIIIICLGCSSSAGIAVPKVTKPKLMLVM